MLGSLRSSGFRASGGQDSCLCGAHHGPGWRCPKFLSASPHESMYKAGVRTASEVHVGKRRQTGRSRCLSRAAGEGKGQSAAPWPSRYTV